MVKMWDKQCPKCKGDADLTEFVNVYYDRLNSPMYGAFKCFDCGYEFIDRMD